MPGPTTLGDFVASYKGGTSSGLEWIATLPDFTKVVLRDVHRAPCPLGIKKAVSIVQSRAYLEQQARCLLAPFTQEAGTWHLSALDFGVEAQGHGCEFLMCFAFRASTGMLSVTSPFVEIGFTLPAPTAVDPVFVIAVASAVGVPR